MRTIIAGVGYMNLSDSSIGPLAIAELKKQQWPNNIRVDDLSYGPISVVPIGRIAARFHNMLAEVVVALARHFGKTKVVLSGGCFQNRYLTEQVIDQLTMAGFQPFWQQRVPPNDGGIALGQIWLATSPLREVT